MPALRPKPFSVKFEPCQIPVFYCSNGMKYVGQPLKPAHLTVRSPLQFLGRKVIESACRFTTFDESDEWAFEAGLARVRLEPFRGGDVAHLRDFIDYPSDLRLRCCRGQSIEPSDDAVVMSSVEFFVDDSAGSLLAFIETNERRRRAG